MRVLVLTNLYPNPYDPTRATFNRQQIRALAGEHEVEVISPVSWTDELRARLSGRPALPGDRRVRLDDLVVHHPRYIYTPKVWRSRYGHFYRASVGPTFREVAGEFGPQVILAPWAYPDGWAAVHLGHAAGLPVVLKIHGCDVRWGLSHHQRRLGRTQEALRGADGIIAVSEDLAGICRGFGAEAGRVHVLYDGVDPEKFCPGGRPEARARLGVPPEQPLVLCVASLDPVKGLDVLVDACAALRRSVPNFMCRIIGKGPLKAALESQVARLKLAGHVEFRGALPHDTLPDWYRAADVFVLPSHSEGVPCVLLEAIACGIPFVATRVGGIPEVADLGQGELIEPANAGVLAVALAAALLRPRAPQHRPIRSHTAAARELADILRRYLPAACPVAV